MVVTVKRAKVGHSQDQEHGSGRVGRGRTKHPAGTTYAGGIFPQQAPKTPRLELLIRGKSHLLHGVSSIVPFLYKV